MISQSFGQETATSSYLPGTDIYKRLNLDKKVKKAVYIGIYSEGSTSKMRAEKLRSLLPGWKFDVIDTDIPFAQQHPLFRSLGFRYQKGPLIKAVNSYILQQLPTVRCDLIWIDKAIFIRNKTTKIIREKAHKLIHYTPDTAFYGNQSKMFYQSMGYYDYLVTTKSFELEAYRSRVPTEKIIPTTQGFDSDVHKPLVSFPEKVDRVAFVGLWEPSRERLIQHLINNNINVTLAGYNWEYFIRKNKNIPFLDFKGNSLWNQEYTSLISSSYFSLGILSKRFPELHTTRTVEIPACGTALLTEKNYETSAFFSDNEAIFYSDADELVSKIKYYQEHRGELEQLTLRGHDKVNNEGFDYRNILNRIIRQII